MTDHTKDLDWAYLPVEVKRKFVKGNPSKLAYVKLGITFAERRLHFNELLLYMKAHADEMDQGDRDAMEDGYNQAAQRGPEEKITKRVMVPKKRKSRKKKGRKKSRRPTGRPRLKPSLRKNKDKERRQLHWQYRNAFGRYQRKTEDVPIVGSKHMEAPTLRELRGNAKDLLIPWVELRRRYPMNLHYPGARILFLTVIDRERLLGQICKLSVKNACCRPLANARVPEGVQMGRDRRKKELLAESRGNLAENSE